MQAGGDVLLLIFAITMVMWTLILERLWYFRITQPGRTRQVIDEWEARTDQVSWSAHQIRRLLISEESRQLNHSLPFIKTLVAICPLLGLLGTVTGMIEVFDVMAVAGNANPRAMASGVSRATIPTMAGMVAALSGMYFSIQLERFARHETQRVADHLIHQ
ncbi:MAG: MotA/TolQ/ExbB proton channel family protein [Deltaproteobacteria bacterium]|nr:MotA/TolQ/ExbB proton channel family protein [Deltaproteobacteria bacterium]MBW2419398.1 MotA/TolQ/ExbB proton channel family protein [Deltaproteobacteria bacterium]